MTTQGSEVKMEDLKLTPRTALGWGLVLLLFGGYGFFGLAECILRGVALPVLFLLAVVSVAAALWGWIIAWGAVADGEKQVRRREYELDNAVHLRSHLVTILLPEPLSFRMAQGMVSETTEERLLHRIEHLRSLIEGLTAAGISEAALGEFLQDPPPVPMTAMELRHDGGRQERALRLSLHLLRILCRHQDNTVGEALFSMTMLWLDENVIDEADPDLDALTKAWAQLLAKQRLGHALARGCLVCGGAIGEHLWTEHKDGLRHQHCTPLCGALCPESVLFQYDITGEVRCGLDEKHFGDHGAGALAWRNEDDITKRHERSQELRVFDGGVAS